MWPYIIKRILLVIPTLFGISLVTFCIINLAPGDPAQVGIHHIPGENSMTEETYRSLQSYYKLDKPLPIRYLHWLGRLGRLDFGYSMAPDHRPVINKIGERFWPTVTLMLLSLGISLSLSIPMGVYMAAWKNRPFDTISSFILYCLYSVPGYVMAMLVIMLFGVRWGILPFQGMTSDNFTQLSNCGKILDLIRHYSLITFCFSFGSWAYFSRFVRQNMLEVLQQDYIRTARAKGIPPARIIWHHGLANALVPLLTLLGMLLPEILGGSVILEVMFNWPGMGRLFFESMYARDYPTIMALTFISACLVLLGTLVADIGYIFIDPRIKYDNRYIQRV